MKIPWWLSSFSETVDKFRSPYILFHRQRGYASSLSGYEEGHWEKWSLSYLTVVTGPKPSAISIPDVPTSPVLTTELPQKQKKTNQNPSEELLPPLRPLWILCDSLGLFMLTNLHFLRHPRLDQIQATSNLGGTDRGERRVHFRWEKWKESRNLVHRCPS